VGGSVQKRTTKHKNHTSQSRINCLKRSGGGSKSQSVEGQPTKGFLRLNKKINGSKKEVQRRLARRPVWGEAGSAQSASDGCRAFWWVKQSSAVGMRLGKPIRVEAEPTSWYAATQLVTTGVPGVHRPPQGERNQEKTREGLCQGKRTRTEGRQTLCSVTEPLGVTRASLTPSTELMGHKQGV